MVIVVIAGISIVVLTNSGNEQKPDVTQLEQSMLVDPSSFPVIDGANWIGPEVKTGGNISSVSGSKVKPPECVAFFEGPHSTQVGRMSLQSKGSAFGMTIGLTAERPDYQSLVSACRTVRTADEQQYAIEQRHLSGLPAWSITTLRTHGGDWLLSTVGFHRGVFLWATCSQTQGEDAPKGFGLGAPDEQDNLALVKLFNDQVAKLDAV
ncbi:MAG TPA: hypothetical protein VFB19_16025 [Mycobacterium sp.]|nr:hypothetical protein [Mycobacterium sp.]